LLPQQGALTYQSGNPSYYNLYDNLLPVNQYGTNLPGQATQQSPQQKPQQKAQQTQQHQQPRGGGSRGDQLKKTDPKK
jgi:hypothetical protein